MRWDSMWLRKLGVAALPGLVVSALGVILWLTVIHGRGGPLAFIGWVEVMMVLATVAAIVWAASTSARERLAVRSGASTRYVFLGYALLGDLVGILLLIVGVGGGFIGWGELLRMYAVLIAWTGLWTAAAWAMRRWGIGASIALPSVVAMLLVASPIAGMPLVRAAAYWGTGNAATSPWQGRVADAIGASCPGLAMVQAARPAIRVDWAVLPRMYALSGLGQEVPVTLPAWWVNASLYAAGAVVLGLAGHLARPADAGGRG